jgi:UDP-hydrolysing UDP-N-acetyl-D-glucosamine 2-epimerase
MNAPHRIAFVSTGRADFSNHAAVLDALDPARVSPRVLLAGDVFLVHAEAVSRVGASRVTVLDELNGERDPALVCASLLPRCAEALADVDAAVVVGDRWELLPVLTAAVLRRVPLVHLAGGELTYGALDEQVRHAVTKAAHLHCVAHESFAQRLRRMGEEPWRVHVTGDPGLDLVRTHERADLDELQSALELPVDRRTVVVALHPVTNAPDEALRAWTALTHALSRHDGSVVVTAPNRDPGADALRDAMSRACAARPGRWRFVEHLGARRLYGLLQRCGALVGNSSAGIWESPSLDAVSINVGTRQEGRLRGPHTLDVAADDAVGLRAALRRALDGELRASLAGVPNPYGDGHGGARVAALLAELPARDRLLHKRFDDTNDAR